MRFALAALLVGHAAVHAVMWTLPFTDAVHDMPFDPADSWVLGRHPWFAAGLAGITSAGLLGAAVGTAFATSWWPPLLAGSAALSLLLVGLYWSPYWSVGIALDIAFVVYAFRVEPA